MTLCLLPRLSISIFVDPPKDNKSSLLSSRVTTYKVEVIMGFPAVGYCSEMPKMALHLLVLLSQLRRLSSWLLRLTGLDDDDQYHLSYTYIHDAAGGDRILLEEHAPAVRFDSLAASAGAGQTLPEGCAVCLADFHGAAEVRRARGCRHVLHRACIDRWAAHGQNSCPLCRSPLLPMPLPPS